MRNASPRVLLGIGTVVAAILTASPALRRNPDHRDQQSTDGRLRLGPGLVRCPERFVQCFLPWKFRQL